MSSEQYQRMVNSFDKEIADLEKKKATKDKEVATLQGKINTLKIGSSFETPKPIRLIRKILNLVKLESDDIILDFFSGSATTAHAVM